MAAGGKTTRIYEVNTEWFVSNGFKLKELAELHSSGTIDHRTFLRLELAVQEAVTNGFEHGNLGLISAWKEEIGPDGRDRFTREREVRLTDPSYAKKKVRIAVEYNEQEIIISIQDEGNGFSPDRTKPSEGVESFGRGLSMIRSSMDQVTFEDSGRTIKMVKKLSRMNGHGTQI